MLWSFLNCLQRKEDICVLSEPRLRTDLQNVFIGASRKFLCIYILLDEFYCTDLVFFYKFYVNRLAVRVEERFPGATSCISRKVL